MSIKPQADSEFYLKLNKILKISILILLLVLLILMRTYKLDSCDKCNFNISGDKLSQAEFMRHYSGKCLVEKDKVTDLGYVNVTEKLVLP